MIVGNQGGDLRPVADLKQTAALKLGVITEDIFCLSAKLSYDQNASEEEGVDGPVMLLKPSVPIKQRSTCISLVIIDTARPNALRNSFYAVRRQRKKAVCQIQSTHWQRERICEDFKPRFHT